MISKVVLMEIARNYSIIADLLDEDQSILVLGPRATGKTYYLSRILAQFKNTINIDLLNNAEFERFIATPEFLYKEISSRINDSQSKLYVMIDEIQRIPKLLNEVHRSIEDFKGKVIFILTGSSARKLRRDENADLLAGRAISIHFHPLSSLEIDFANNLERILLHGTLPEIFLSKSERVISEKIRSYVGTYLTEEIQRESEIRRLDKFHRFLEVSASMNGSGINYAKLARLVGVSAPTVKEYYTILKDTLIAQEVPPWTFSVKKQIQQASKYYFFDNGVLNAIEGNTSINLKPSTSHYGKLFENLVVNEILRLIDIKRLPVKCFNYKTTTDQEVDLILQRNSQSPIVAIEIKSSTKPSIEDVSALEIFSRDYPDSHCIVICRTPRSYEEGRIKFMPFVEGMNEAITKASL